MAFDIHYFINGIIFGIQTLSLKIKNMKLLMTILVSAILISCGNSKEIVKEEIKTTIEDVEITDNNEYPKPERPVKIKAKIGDFTDSDPIEIKSVKIIGNIMYMQVSFSGGCAEHGFELIGSPVVMKSLPPKRTIRLIHNNNDDACRSIVNKSLEIDLTDIAYSQTSGSELMLMLKGWKEQILYTYQ